MLRTALVYALPAVLIATSWLRLEDGGRGSETVAMVLLALVPALARPWWARALAGVVAALVAIRLALGLSVLDARPRDEERDFFGPVVSAFWSGSLEYFERAQPFSPEEFPLMHSVLLLTVFAFCLALGVAIAARRPLLASFILVAGAAWPATLVAGADLRRGAFLLAAVLVLLAAGGLRAPRVYRPAVFAGAALLVASLAAAAQPAVAKSEFLDWKTWDFYDAPVDPVGVRYVWDANYGGIEFPEEETTVLTIKGPERGLYWRATTLDSFVDHRWVAERDFFLRSGDVVDLTSDNFLPQRGRDPRRWTEAEVTVEALRDDHLVSPGMPVRYDPGDLGVVEYRPGGVAVVPDGLEHGQEYRVWAYAPRPKPEELARARSTTRHRKSAQERYLEVVRGVSTAPFGFSGRERALETLFTAEPIASELAPYRELYQQARRVVGSPRNAYAAVVALEAWFRSGGGFSYDEQPPVAPAGRPPLLHFTLESKRGYCQHYAGAMALMLRYLGIPARVAAGFTNGTYERLRSRWKITNHDAHAWVEVWFEGWGWVPFDPTPARGQLAGSYSSSSESFSAAGVSALLAGAGVGVTGRQVVDGIRSERLVGVDGSPRADTPGDLAIGAAAVVADRGESLLRLLVLVALAVAAAIVAAKTALRRGRYVTRDPRRLAGACRSELVDILLDQGVRVSRSATLAELADLAQNHLFVDADRFAHVTARARFAQLEDAQTAASEARRELRAVRRALRRRLGVRRRLRGLLSVRSLGFQS
jgi:transglutaminase-like putative cysteine protease